MSHKSRFFSSLDLEDHLTFIRSMHNGKIAFVTMDFEKTASKSTITQTSKAYRWKDVLHTLHVHYDTSSFDLFFWIAFYVVFTVLISLMVLHVPTFNMLNSWRYSVFLLIVVVILYILLDNWDLGLLWTHVLMTTCSTLAGITTAGLLLFETESSTHFCYIMLHVTITLQVYRTEQYLYPLNNRQRLCTCAVFCMGLIWLIRRPWAVQKLTSTMSCVITMYVSMMDDAYYRQRARFRTPYVLRRVADWYIDLLMYGYTAIMIQNIERE
ncbi:membrane protein S29 [Saimiriine betaherpesvirus 4]|uniref:Membrane protein S29 n=1 Tax=Saimiriine betaherpesvirus 4 TaxID=1535247 RepID=G8XT55_9BETA|nr:membrane protein S29 [Saimiriine betaherpesvirus 4]AEV81004.1 membrane protein S29 [Saimiriine betaherpesvirus 4]